MDQFEQFTERCLLTGYKFPAGVEFRSFPNIPKVLSYEFPPVGLVFIHLETLVSMHYNDKHHSHPILAGICRNAFENKADPPLIDQDFITNEIINILYPKTFEEKGRHLLKYMYKKGGNDIKPFNFNAHDDFPLCYASDMHEFIRIVDDLKDQGFIKWKYRNTYVGGGDTDYTEVQLKKSGVEEVVKELPKVPMIGLVSQEITTGDPEIDKKINHAKDLFFQEPQTTDRMRSACETLSYVLEPLRYKFGQKQYLKQKDVEDFFIIVNNFDIRHNKENTKNIVHPEQLEWIFYSLLNTINTYTKLEKRLSNGI